MTDDEKALLTRLEIENRAQNIAIRVLILALKRDQPASYEGVRTALLDDLGDVSEIEGGEQVRNHLDRLIGVDRSAFSFAG